MATKNVRFMLTVPNDMVEKVEMLKKNFFYDKPYSEMYRQLIQLGLEKISETEKNNKTVSQK